MTPRETATPTRRRVLASASVALGAVALAGCTTGDSEDTGSETGGDDTVDGPADTDDNRSDEESGSETAGDDTPDSSTDTNDTGGEDDQENTGDSGDTGGDETAESDCAGETVHESYEETDVTITTPDGEQLGSVTAAIADTGNTRRTGLSETDCLPPDRGMVFVYGSTQSLSFWMKQMDFGLDIVHIDDEGVITSIQHAKAPAEDESGTEKHHQYPGTGQFVLEVNYGWTIDHGVEVGDVVDFTL